MKNSNTIEQFREHILKQSNKMKPYKENSEVTYEMITTHPYFKTLNKEELRKVIDTMGYYDYSKIDGLDLHDKLRNILNLFNKTTMQKLIISITEVLEIHKIACSTWKTKIANYLTRVDSNQNITFTQSEVDEMFKAATSEQKPVLTKIFGEQKPIEWDKIKTGSKVMLKETGKICNVSKEVDFTKEFDVIFYNTPYLISASHKFSKESVCEKYCTFHQDSKFILFDGVNNDYITEVIEY